MSQFQFRRFEVLPPIIKNLVIINALFFLARITFKDEAINLLALHFYKSDAFKPWQLVTHMFMHVDFFHLFFNMFALWMFGNILENLWGPKRFIIFYLLCGFAAAIANMAVLGVQFHQLELKGVNASEFDFIKASGIYNGVTLGASGAVYGVMAAFGYLFPNTLLYIYFMFPVKAKYAMIAMIVLEFVLGTASIAGDNVAHFAHLGGALFGLLLVIFWNRTNRKRFY